MGVLRSLDVSIGRTFRAARAAAAAALLLGAAIPIVGGSASGAETIGDLKARLAVAQARLDESTAKIEDLEDVLEHANNKVAETRARMAELQKKDAKLEAEVVERAKLLYMSGRGDMLEALFGSDTFAELSEAAEMLSQVNLDDADVFIELARSRAELIKLQDALLAEKDELKASFERLKAEHAKQQEMFDSISSDYESLQDRVAGPSAPSAARIRSTGGMFCPVGGPTSFVDSWGAPRAGHTHQGVDMMGSYGTPLVAIVSGTITYAAYDGSGGNMIFLSGDDGNAYWYMHNQQNYVTGGHVTAGQTIAALGDTGNAAGTPHLHFEYHPGGGSAVNPTPLVASIC
jgi:murein DD-endopeptidase MepM/ murein hydrolase activator NlpD